MLRDKLFKSREVDDDYFRTRGGEVKRIEGFSDAVFAFAVTLLVISLEVPKTFDELITVLRDFPAFILSCLLLLVVWKLHYNYFRHYGLEDRITIALNGVLLITVLFFVYPLKFLFTYLTYGLLGIDSRVPLPEGGFQLMLTDAQSQPLLIIYGAGYVAVFTVFVLLYWHAYSKRHELELNELETRMTRDSVAFGFINAGVAVLSVLVALALPDDRDGLAGMTYLLTIPLQFLRVSVKRRRQATWLKQQAASDTSADLSAPEPVSTSIATDH